MSIRHGHPNLLVALAGQPNCGKSTVFNMLTGADQHVANFPGVTVEKKQGSYRDGETRIEVVDLPGTYSLTSFTQEERVARDFVLLERPEVMVAVVDASNLERHLMLVIQLREMRIPMALCLNMTDVATRRGIAVDVEKLSESLDMPVVPTVARQGDGREELVAAVREIAAVADHDPGVWKVDYGPGLESHLEALTTALADRPHLMEDFAPRWLAVKLLENDGEARRIVLHHTHDDRGGDILGEVDALRERYEAETGGPTEDAVIDGRHAAAARIAAECVSRSERPGGNLTDRIDGYLCNPVIGLGAAALVMYAAFHLTFAVSDGWRWVPWVDGWTTPVGVFGWFFEDALPRISSGLPEGALRSLVDDGILKGVGGVMGFVPILFCMFFFLALLEDSGCIARIAFILDRFVRIFGLQGQSILPLIMSGGLSGGCAVPGVMATRSMRDERGRLVTMLVVPLMNCGAKLPVYAVLIGAFFARAEGMVMLLVLLLSWVFTLVAAALLSAVFVKGEQTPFIMELPAYHAPRLRSALRSAWQRARMYLRKAGTLILGAAVALWALMYFPRLDETPFDARRAAADDAFRAAVDGTPYAPVAATDALEDFDALVAQALRDPDMLVFDESRTAAETDLANEIARIRWGSAVPPRLKPRDPERIRAVAEDWLERKAELTRIDADHTREALAHSAAGRFGRLLEPVSRVAGFAWRDNVALVGGVVAKEIILSTLGTAYSLGARVESDSLADANRADEEDDGETALAKALRAEPDWSAVRAFAMLVFIMTYCPCMPTVMVIVRESGSWKWGAFAVLYTTVFAFALATVTYQVGTLLFS